VHFPLYTLDANRLDRRFRWVALQLEELQDCSDETEIRETLRNIPPTLEQTYERTLIRMPEKNQARVRTILLWLIYSVRPLSLPEVAAAAGLTFREDVLRICTSSLVSTSTGVIRIDSERETRCEIVRLAHFSVQEYLCSGKTRNMDEDHFFHMDSKLGHLEIGMQCVKELLKLDQDFDCCSSTGVSDDEPDGEPDGEPDNESVRNLFALQDTASEVEILISPHAQITNDESDHDLFIEMKFDNRLQRVLDYNPLLLYSAPNWFKHAELIQPADTETKALVDLINKFFSNEASLCYTNYHRIYTHVRQHLFFEIRRVPERVVPLYFASSKGLIDNVFELVSQHLNVNSESVESEHGTCLAAASAAGHVNIVQLLLKSGADLNLISECPYSHYSTALAAASAAGHINIVQLLLKSEADVNLNRNPKYKSNTALGAALAAGHVNIVQLLLQSGAEFNIKSECINDKYGTALAAASAVGYVNMVQFLLKVGADVNLHVPKKYTPLQAACNEGRDKVVPYLLKAGAVVDLVGDTESGRTALQIACERSSGETQNIVAELLEAGADVNQKGSLTALQLACYKGDAGLIAQLLNAGADPNLKGQRKNLPLVLAIKKKHHKVIVQLLKAGAHPNIQDRSDRTPLWYARHSDDSGKDRMIETLLAAGAANVDASHDEKDNIPRSYTSPRSVGSGASSTASSDVEE